VIVLAAWILVDTLMRFLIGNGGQFENGTPWSDVQCWSQVTPTLTQFEIEQFTISGGDHIDNTGAVPGPSTPSARCPATPASEVVTIPGTNYKAKQDVADDFVRMRAAAAADGVTLRVTSGWRSEAKQVSLWNQRATIGLVAKPCSLGGSGSNHNSGEALDISVRPCSKAFTNCTSAPYIWLRANAADYGFYNRLPNDILHWSRTGR
jgi:hypothetical protein